jgi:hypothetical protein
MPEGSSTCPCFPAFEGLTTESIESIEWNVLSATTSHLAPRICFFLSHTIHCRASGEEAPWLHQVAETSKCLRDPVIEGSPC